MPSRSSWLDPLGLAAGERGRGAVEAQVEKPDLLKEVEPRADLGQDVAGDIRDPDHGGAFTVKRCHSEKIAHPDHHWQHPRITLACDTHAEGYEDIFLAAGQQRSAS